MATPGGAPRAAGMVAGVRAGGFLFLSAIRGNVPGVSGGGFSPQTGEQARQAFENLRAILEANGASLRDVVKVTLYLHDLSYRAAFHEVWKEYYPQDPPARIAVRVADASASPDRPGAHFALDVVALAPDA